MNHIFYRTVSVLMLLYLSIVRLGMSGSYMDAIGAASLFAGIWWLGHESKNASGGGV